MKEVTAQFIVEIAVVITFALALQSGLNFAHAQSIADVNKLSAKLLQGYNRNTLPSNNQSEPFTIYLRASLMDLGGLDEVNEQLTTIMVFIYQWRDDSITWDAAEHHVTNITMNQESVWLPYLRVINIHHKTSDGPKEKDMDKVLYFSNGMALFQQIRTLHTVCELDIKYYPFDIQKCKIEMYISGYIGYSFRMEILWDYDLMFKFYSDGNWDIVDNKTVGSSDSGVTITFVFKRKPLYILVNIILPIFVLVLLTPLVFLLPNSAGDRIGFAMTTLLAISVYMTIICSYLPQKSDPLPLVSILLFAWYVTTAIMVVVAILNVNIHSRPSDTYIPTATARFVKFYRYLSRKRKASNMQNTETVDGVEERAEKAHDNITWQDVSEAVDLLVMVSVYVIYALVTVIFMLVLYFDA